MSEGEVSSLSELNRDDLEDKLRTIYDPNFSTLGHGTRLEATKEIMENGLRARYPDLQTTTMPLLNGSKPYKEQVNRVIETVVNWPHLRSKAVIVVMIPNPPEDSEIKGFRYFNSVFQEIGEPDTGYNTRYVIPRNYIKGYVDIESRRFVPNASFDPQPLKVKTEASISLDRTAVQKLKEVRQTPKTAPKPDVW